MAGSQSDAPIRAMDNSRWVTGVFGRNSAWLPVTPSYAILTEVTG